jgi:hypothetical protein
VNDAIELVLGEDTREGWLVSDVGFENLIVGILFLNANVVTFNRGILEVVENIHDCNAPVSLGEQTIYEMRSDEAGSAGNQDVFHKRRYLVLGTLFLVRSANLPLTL